MSVLAMIGFVLGGLAATGWIVVAERLPAGPVEPEPLTSQTKAPVPPSKPLPEIPARPPAPVVLIEKPLIARLQESDVMRTLGGILAIGGIPDMTRIGWPTLRAGLPSIAFLNAMREMREMLAKRSPADAPPVMVVIGAGANEDRAITTLNVALAASRDGAGVLIIDADHAAHALSSKVNGLGKTEAGRTSWLSIGTKAPRIIKTANGISILPAIKGSGVKGSDVKASGAICKAIAQARSAGGYDLVILDGPQTPWSVADRALLDAADGLVAVLPANLDINDCMEDIITELGGAERKLIGVVLSELQPTTAQHQRDRQYA
jgi:Mrp family chromosome partitioning ATPase